MDISINVDYLFKGNPFSLTTSSTALSVSIMDPMDQSTYERQLIEHLVEQHYGESDVLQVSAQDIRNIIQSCGTTNAYANAQFARLFGFEQVIVHIQGYCFPLAA